MTLLPFENVKLYSTLSQNEVENTIKNNIAWNKELGITFTKNSLKDYEGFVENRTFKIRRILKFGVNSFIPIVSGNISQTSNGSIIELKLRLHKIVMVFTIIFTLFSGSLLITPFSSEPSEQLTELLNDDLLKETLSQKQYEELKNIANPKEIEKEIDWNGIFLFIAPYLMCTIFFNYEARIVKNELKSILKIKKTFANTGYKP